MTSFVNVIEWNAVSTIFRCSFGPVVVVVCILLSSFEIEIYILGTRDSEKQLMVSLSSLSLSLSLSLSFFLSLSNTIQGTNFGQSSKRSLNDLFTFSKESFLENAPHHKVFFFQKISKENGNFRFVTFFAIERKNMCLLLTELFKLNYILKVK